MSNISFTVDDGGTPNLQDSEPFVFTVTPFNDPPVMNAIGAQSTNEDTQKVVSITISDIDDALNCATSLSVTTNNAGLVPIGNVAFTGGTSIAGGSVICTATITPVADANGSVDLTFITSDTGIPIKTDTEVVTLSVSAVNDAPILAAIGAQSTNEDTAKAVSVTISDVDNALNCTTALSVTTNNAGLVPIANVVFTGGSSVAGGSVVCTATITPVADANGSVN